MLTIVRMAERSGLIYYRVRYNGKGTDFTVSRDFIRQVHGGWLSFFRHIIRDIKKQAVA